MTSTFYNGEQTKEIQLNSVITNSLGLTRPDLFIVTGIRYNWVDLCTKWSFGNEYVLRYNRVFVITE